jgi:hypothetical protein
MNQKARAWTGITLLVVIAFNYMLIGVPLISKSASIEKRSKEIIAGQAKSKNVFRKADDAYILEVLRREKASLDRNTAILNCAAASLAFLVVSWTVFGLLFRWRR